jgi:multidrug efflux system outer membrane protein
LSLSAAFGLGADDPRWLTARTARTGSIGLAVGGTIFNGFRVEGDIREAEAIQKQKVVLFQQAVQTALKEVEDALVWRNKAGEREAAIGKLVGTLQDVARLARLRYEGGQTTFKDVLDAERQLYAVQAKQAQSRGETLLALVSVYRAMGGGWMMEVEKRRAPVKPAAEVQARAAIQQETGK